MNVDEKEVQKFDNISYSWWDPEGPFKPLHMLNPIRTNFIKNQIDLKNKSLIDVGCGGGLLCENLASNYTKITGIDDLRIDKNETIIAIVNTSTIAHFVITSIILYNFSI